MLSDVNISIESYNFGEVIFSVTNVEETVDMEETVHNVKLKFANAPEDFCLSASERASIIRFVKGKNLNLQPLEHAHVPT